jgi:hypothetical protein
MSRNSTTVLTSLLLLLLLPPLLLLDTSVVGAGKMLVDLALSYPSFF